MRQFERLLNLVMEDGEGAGTVVAGDVAVFNPVLGAGKKNKRKVLKKVDEIDETSDNKKGIVTGETEDHLHFLADLKDNMTANDGSANITTTPADNHTHTVSLSAEQVDKILDQRQVRTHTSKDNGHTHEVVFISSKKLEELDESMQGDEMEMQQEGSKNLTMKYKEESEIDEREDLAVVADRARQALSAEAARKRQEADKKLASSNESYMIEDAGEYIYFREGEKKVFEMFEEKDFNVFIQGLKKSNPRFWRTTPTNEAMMIKMNENRGLWFEVRFGDQVFKPFDKR